MRLLLFVDAALLRVYIIQSGGAENEMSRSPAHCAPALQQSSSSGHPSATAVLVDSEALSAGVPLYQAVADHTPSHDGELTLTASDIITSVRQLGNGWALGRNDSAPDRPFGIFPASCVVAVTTSRPPTAVGNFVECRRCGGSLPVSRTQPPLPQKRLSGHWDHRCAGGPADAAAALHREEERAEIELQAPRSLHHCSPAQPAAQPRETPAAITAGDSEEPSTPAVARVSFPADELPAVDSPSTVPRRIAPMPPKPQLIVKPTRDKPAPVVNDYATPISKCPDWPDAETAAAARVTSPAKPPRRRQRDDDDDDDERHQGWCGVRSSGRRRSRGPPPPPPARALSTFVGRSDPTLRQTVLAASSPPHSAGDSTDSRCGCIDSLGVARRSMHPALRTRRCQSGVPACTANGTSPLSGDPSFGVPLQPGALRPGRPILRLRSPRVADGVLLRAGGRRYSTSSSAGSRLSVWGASCRLIGSMSTGILLGVLTFAELYFDQSCDVYTSLVAGFVVAVITALLLGVSRFCRCVGALVPVSLSTVRGRVAFCLVAFSVLLAAPVPNVYRNAGEAVRSLTCSAELALNRTASLLRPFDAMMSQLDRTVTRLEGAAADVAQGLEPLDEGLDAVEMDVENARTQLLGTRRVSQIINAYIL